MDLVSKGYYMVRGGEGRMDLVSKGYYRVRGVRGEWI